MLNKSQNQNVSGDNSKALTAERDAIDNSTNVTFSYNNYEAQVKKDFGIIEDIFKFLFNKGVNNLDLVEKSNGKGLKKIPLNFSGDSKKTIEEMILRTTPKINIVRNFVNTQNEIDKDKIDALILKLQKDFRNLKEIENNYAKIESVNIVEKMAENCIEESKRNNPEYQMNALAIILYFFEMCDFGVSE